MFPMSPEREDDSWVACYGVQGKNTHMLANLALCLTSKIAERELTLVLLPLPFTALQFLCTTGLDLVVGGIFNY